MSGNCKEEKNEKEMKNSKFTRCVFMKPFCIRKETQEFPIFVYSNNWPDDPQTPMGTETVDKILLQKVVNCFF